MLKHPNINIELAINTFTFYLNVVTFFVFMYNNAHFASDRFIFIFIVGELFMNFIIKKYEKNSKLTRSYGIIIILFVLILPVLKNMVAQIDTDTIYLTSGVCLLFFSVETTKTHILKLYTPKLHFDRNKPIPIHLAILIPYKHENNNTIGNVVSSFSIINVVSRLKNDHEVLFLLKTSFLLLYLLPNTLIYAQVYITNKVTILLMLTSQFVFFVLRDRCCFCLTTFILFPTYLAMHQLIKYCK